jgi:hypothetical protein
MSHACAIACLLAVLSGCERNDPLAALDAVDSYELFSLDPDTEHVTDAAASFHGYRVLGSTSISAGPTRARLNDALRAPARRPRAASNHATASASRAAV